MTPADCKNLTFREIQLLKVFRLCDDRGRSLVERVAEDQSRHTKQPVRLALMTGGRHHEA